jgi:hypothetical protein
MHHGGASTDPESAVSVDLATPTATPLEHDTIDPRFIALQRQYAELGEALTALQTKVDDLEQQLHRPLSDYLTEAGVRY